jgi:hypothetical protein
MQSSLSGTIASEALASDSDIGKFYPFGIRDPSLNKGEYAALPLILPQFTNMT